MLIIVLASILVNLFCVRQAYQSTTDIIFGGDVSFSGIVYYLKRIGNCSYEESFREIAPEFSTADEVVLNLESPLGDVENPPPVASDKKTVHLMSEADSARTLRVLNTTAVSLANNHILDFGEATVNFTYEYLLRLGIAFSGISFGKSIFSPQVPVLFDKNNVTIALLSYCVVQEGCNDTRGRFQTGPATFSKYSFMLDLMFLKKHDIAALVVYLHWGSEYTIMQSDKKSNDLIRFLQKYVDVIIGSHPHVKNGHFYVNGTLVVQSLGNFLFPMRGTPFKQFNMDHKTVTNNQSAAERIFLMMKKYKNPTALSRIVKLRFNKKGLDRANSLYMDLVIDVNERHCMYVRKTKEKSDWKVICATDDMNCLGDNECNIINCETTKGRIITKFDLKKRKPKDNTSNEQDR